MGKCRHTLVHKINAHTYLYTHLVSCQSHSKHCVIHLLLWFLSPYIMPHNAWWLLPFSIVSCQAIPNLQVAFVHIGLLPQKFSWPPFSQVPSILWLNSGIASWSPMILWAHRWLPIFSLSIVILFISLVSPLAYKEERFYVIYLFFKFPTSRSVIGIKRKCTKSLWTGRYYTTNKNPTVRASF